MKKNLTLLLSLTLLVSCSKKYSPEQFYGTYAGNFTIWSTTTKEDSAVISPGSTKDRLKIQIGHIEDELSVTEFKTGAFMFEHTASSGLKSGFGTITPIRLAFNAKSGGDVPYSFSGKKK